MKCEIGTNFLEKRNNEYAEVFFKSFKIGIEVVLILINVNNNHWCLCNINLKKKRIYFLNPLNTEPTNGYLKYLFTKIAQSGNSVIVKLFGDDKYWKVDNFSHNIQEDGYNCGVHVLFMCKQYIEASIIYNSPDFNPDRYRFSLRDDILLESSSMQYDCMVCNNDVADTKMIQFLIGMTAMNVHGGFILNAQTINLAPATQ